MLQANSDASPWGAHIQDIDENNGMGRVIGHTQTGVLNNNFWIRWSAFVEQWVLKFRTHVFGWMIICHYLPIGLSFPMPSFKLGTSPQPWQPSLPVWGKLCRPMDLSLSCKVDWSRSDLSIKVGWLKGKIKKESHEIIMLYITFTIWLFNIAMENPL